MDDPITLRICGPAKPGSIISVKCKYCNTNLNCSDCDEKVKCLGRSYYNFCSKDCADLFHEREIKMRKLRNYFWEHPFQATAIFGVSLTLTTLLIAAFMYLKPLAAFGAAGVLIAAAVGVAALIHF